VAAEGEANALLNASSRGPPVERVPPRVHCKKFIEDYSKSKNRARTVENNQRYMDRHIIPGLGNLKVREDR
jgi:hypothetical protein